MEILKRICGIITRKAGGENSSSDNFSAPEKEGKLRPLRGSGKPRSLKKGISIMETVVSLAVIALISFTAIGFIGRFSTVNTKMIYETRARLSAENALECFKYADNTEDFFTALSLTEQGYEKSENIYTLNDYNYTVFVMVSYPDSEGKAYFECKVTDKDNKVIISIDSYSKEIKQ